jgi:hypothetical protein
MLLASSLLRLPVVLWAGIWLLALPVLAQEDTGADGGDPAAPDAAAEDEGDEGDDGDDGDDGEDLDATLEEPQNETHERESPFKRSGAVPTAGKPIKVVSASCQGVSDRRGFRDLPTILRGQYLLAGNMPSDLMLRCDERTVDIGLRQDDTDERIKTKSFTSDTEAKARTMEASFRAGGRAFRYGLQLEKSVHEAATTTKVDGAQTSRSSVTGDTNAARIEGAGRFGDFTGGLIVNHVSRQNKRETPVAGQTVATTGKRVAVSQPGVSAGWQRGNSQVLLGRLQAAAEDDGTDSVVLPWVTTLRYVQVLEPDQGVRVHLERVGSTGAGHDEFNRGLVGYFLMIDNVTVDVAWFGRSSSYQEAANATADQLGTFGFAASTVWQYSPTTDFYGSLHSLSANETLGGAEKRTGHKLVTGGNLGLQVAF